MVPTFTAFLRGLSQLGNLMISVVPDDDIVPNDEHVTICDIQM